MFTQLGVIGCGLMGGSFALALKRAGLVKRVVGYSKSPSTTERAKKLGVIDEIVPEPKGGAHRASAEAIAATGEAIGRALQGLSGLSPDALRSQRRDKFLGIGRNL